MGHTVNFRSYKDSYKDKNQKFYPKEDWLIFENTHPAIIDPETWKTAQRRRKTVRRTDIIGEANPLTGLVFCADYGAKLLNHRDYSQKQYVCKATGKIRTRSVMDVYECATFKLTNRFKLNDAKCTQHHISTNPRRHQCQQKEKADYDYPFFTPLANINRFSFQISRGIS